MGEGRIALTSRLPLQVDVDLYRRIQEVHAEPQFGASSFFQVRISPRGALPGQGFRIPP